jgi:hypothetical protein
VDRDARDPSLNEVRQDLRQEIQASAAETRQYVDATAVDLRQEIQASAAEVRRELREEIRASAAEIRADLRQEIQGSAAETRRHFDVVAEALRSDNRLLAEGLVALDQKVERFHAETQEQFHQVDRRLLRLEVERR